MDDIRLDVGFFDHPKTKRLRRRLGIEGVIALLKLWIYASRYFPKGILTGLTAADVEETTEWSGTPGEFVPALVDAGGPGKAGFLDVGEGVFVLHNWKIRNRFAYFKPERSAQAQRANDARWSKIRKEKQEVNPDRTPDRTPDQNPPLPPPPPPPPPKSINTDPSAGAPGAPALIPQEEKTLLEGPPDQKGKQKSVVEGKQKGKQTISRGQAEGNIEKKRMSERYEYPADFMEFWSAYPRRENKSQARKEWETEKKYNPEFSLPRLVLAAKTYADEVSGREKEHIKMPSTFLHAGTWMEKVPADLDPRRECVAS